MCSLGVVRSLAVVVVVVVVSMALSRMFLPAAS